MCKKKERLSYVMNGKKRKKERLLYVMDSPNNITFLHFFLSYVYIHATGL